VAKKKNNVSKAKKAGSAKKTSAKKLVPSASNVQDALSRRNVQRIPVQLLVDYQANGTYLFDFCRDLGAGGVFIQTESPLPIGSSLDLTFTIPDSKETLITKGEVIWVQDNLKQRKDAFPGMGVQFSQFSDKDRKVLDEFVRRFHGDRFIASEKKSA
jgi:uncharacterized protein (TIGR02266 family)